MTLPVSDPLSGPLARRLGLAVPIVQAPMAGVSTPALAAAVSNAGAMGSIAVGAVGAAGAREMIADLRSRTDRPFNVNVFVHRAPVQDASREAAWLAELAPLFRRFGTEPPEGLRAIYPSFNEDDGLLAALVEARPPVVSFHFGIPELDRVEALRGARAFLVASVTCLAEGIAAEKAGMDAVVAQGFEAGGHRGVFDPAAADERLGTLPLTGRLVQHLRIPVIAAGGIMDGAGVAAALRMGAGAAQLGTAFIACPESGAGAAHRSALLGKDVLPSVMTPGISGRPARGLVNRITALAEELVGRLTPPDYPLAYDAARALHAAAAAHGENGYGAHWAGEGAHRARALPAAELMGLLAAELKAAQGNGHDVGAPGERT